jgi:hypothetical protein
MSLFLLGLDVLGISAGVTGLAIGWNGFKIGAFVNATGTWREGLPDAGRLVVGGIGRFDFGLMEGVDVVELRSERVTGLRGTWIIIFTGPDGLLLVGASGRLVVGRAGLLVVGRAGRLVVGGAGRLDLVEVGLAVDWCVDAEVTSKRADSAVRKRSRQKTWDMDSFNRI